MNKLLSGFILLNLGLVLGYLGQPFLSEQLREAGLISEMEGTGVEASGPQVLYWVAPMDANYRRDKPGKSPMGMDLVAVYAEDNAEDGVVKISPVVQNNLGVRLDRVKKGQLGREISTVGYIAFDEDKLFHVHTRVDGWVEKLLAKSNGDKVSKNQKLFELYSPDLVNAQEDYLTALKSQNRILISASRDRLSSLGLSNWQIEQLDKTRKVQQRIDYTARFDGFVQNLTIREGMFIKPSMDLLTIAQIDTVWVIAEVFERQSGWVKVGQKVDMTVAAYPEKSWQGLVDYIYPTLDEKTRTLRVRIRFENPQQLLKPNMFSRLTIHSKDNAETLYVKREAIIRNGQFERVVKSLGDGKFISVAVKTGSENSTDIEILRGLQAGDQIVTSAQFLIDSESSLTAAFERMQEPQETVNKAVTMEAEETRVWIEGTVENVMTGHSMLTIEHPPVAAWGWPSMVMDFTVNRGLDLNSIKVKDPIRFQVEKNADGSILIIDIDNSKKSTGAKPDQAWVKGTIVKVMDKDSKLTLQHGPVEAWGWPSMVMDFPVEKSLSLKTLKKDAEYNFLVEKHSSGSIKIVQMNNEGLK